MRLSNNQAWTEHYFKQQYIYRSSEKPKLYKDSNCFLWLTEDWPEMLTDAAINFDIAHGISIFIDRNDSVVEYISLATNTNNASIHNFYINNLDALIRFNLKFK